MSAQTRRQFLTTSVAALALPLVGRSQQLEPMVPAVNYDALLAAIADVETANRDDVVGPCGSRSRYQLSEVVWKQHICPIGTPFTHRNFRACCKGEIARFVANTHLHWLDRHLPCRTIMEIYTRPYVLAWVYHGGLTSWLRYTSNPAGMSFPTRDSFRLSCYAGRVQALYAERVNELT